MNALFILGSSGSPPAGKKVTADAIGGGFHKGLNYMKQHCFDPIKVNDVIKASKMSRRGLHKTFSKNMGQTPGRELRRIRIERAKDLLINSNHHQSKIARLCGYRSLNSFWVSFRKNVGESPGKFRSRFGNKSIHNRIEESRHALANGKATVILLPQAIDAKWFQQFALGNRTNQLPAGTQLDIFEGRIAFKRLSKKSGILRGSILINALPLKMEAQTPAYFVQDGNLTNNMVFETEEAEDVRLA